jgi:hypothetical protein
VTGADWGQLLGGQLADPFRIGMIVFLVLTMLRTEAATGRWLPLGLGVLFVAALIPMTTGRGNAPLPAAVGLGVVANLLILAVVLAVVEAVRRLRR